jgi:hypothetical protein
MADNSGDDPRSFLVFVNTLVLTEVSVLLGEECVTRVTFWPEVPDVGTLDQFRELRAEVVDRIYAPGRCALCTTSQVHGGVNADIFCRLPPLRVNLRSCSS